MGFSNGGALAVKYALDALSDETLTRPSRLVLISPMIGVTSLARFAGIFGWPAVLPAFAKAAWLSVLPEFNPFKYNSFPIHAARQSCQLTRHIQRQIAEQTRSGQIARLPPILTLQSVLDYTVSTRAIIDGLYRHLPENGSELVLFDLNQNAQLGLLMRTDNNALVSRLLPAVSRHYSTAVISNAGSAALEVHEEITLSGSTTRQRHRLDLSYPPDVYSLSHVALPFPPDDSLYGMEPRSDENFGVQLGGMAARGERAALIVSLDVLIRITSNPFFPYLLQRIEADITADQGRTIQPDTAQSPRCGPCSLALDRLGPAGCGWTNLWLAPAGIQPLETTEIRQARMTDLPHQGARDRPDRPRPWRGRQPAQEPAKAPPPPLPSLIRPEQASQNPAKPRKAACIRWRPGQ